MRLGYGTIKLIFNPLYLSLNLTYQKCYHQKIIE